MPEQSKQLPKYETNQVLAAAFCLYGGWDLLHIQFENRKYKFTFSDPLGDIAEFVHGFQFDEIPVSHPRQLLTAFEDLKRRMWTAKQETGPVEGNRELSNRP
jgi:hypothetical protein